MGEVSIGERLKSAREAKGTSLEEAARLTKVQSRILQAIEEDRVEEVLNGAYAKIFLKKYAAFLGLDGQAVLDEYRSMRGSVAEPPTMPLQPQASSETDSSSLKRILLLAGAGLMFLVGISFLGYLTLDLYQGLSHPGAQREPRPAAPAKGGLTTGRWPAAPSKGAQPQAAKLLVPRSQPLKLAVRTKADVWMQVKADGTVIFQNVLAKGAQESWTADQELELWTGNAGAMELFLNGHSLGSPGSGVKKGIRITREGIKQ
ncbi:MAG: DUF4115 domain-containing protein [Candidatus Omnitrophica bacterium]|nr:DUF4115 domain-containing protein [Candidatus Omnitrophota bacterium]